MLALLLTNDFLCSRRQKRGAYNWFLAQPRDGVFECSVNVARAVEDDHRAVSLQTWKTYQGNADVVSDVFNVPCVPLCTPVWQYIVHIEWWLAMTTSLTFRVHAEWSEHVHMQLHRLLLFTVPSTLAPVRVTQPFRFWNVWKRLQYIDRILWGRKGPNRATLKYTLQWFGHTPFLFFWFSTFHVRSAAYHHDSFHKFEGFRRPFSHESRSEFGCSRGFLNIKCSLTCFPLFFCPTQTRQNMYLVITADVHYHSTAPVL